MVVKSKAVAKIADATSANTSVHTAGGEESSEATSDRRGAETSPNNNQSTGQGVSVGSTHEDAREMEKLESETSFLNLSDERKSQARDVFSHFSNVENYVDRRTVTFSLVFNSKSHNEHNWPDDPKTLKEAQTLMSVISTFNSEQLYKGVNDQGQLDFYIQYIRQTLFDFQKNIPDKFDCLSTRSMSDAFYPYDALYHCFIGQSFDYSVLSRLLAMDAFKFMIRTLFFAWYFIDPKWSQRMDFVELIHMMTQDKIDFAFADSMLYETINIVICRLDIKREKRSFSGWKRDMLPWRLRSLIFVKSDDGPIQVIITRGTSIDVSVKQGGSPFWDECAEILVTYHDFRLDELRFLFSVKKYNALIEESDRIDKQLAGDEVIENVNNSRHDNAFSRQDESRSFHRSPSNESRASDTLSVNSSISEQAHRLMRTKPDMRGRVVLMDEHMAATEGERVKALEMKIDVLMLIRDSDDHNKFHGVTSQISDIRESLDEIRKRVTASHLNTKMNVVHAHGYSSIKLPDKLRIGSIYSTKFITEMNAMLVAVQDYKALKNEDQRVSYSNYAKEQIFANMEDALLTTMGGREALGYGTDFNGLFDKISHYFSTKGDHGLECFDGLWNLKLKPSEDPSYNYINSIDNRIKQLQSQGHPIAFALLIQRLITGLYSEFRALFLIKWETNRAVMSYTVGV